MYSTFGYFKFIIIPIVSATNGIRIELNNIISILSMLNLNLIKTTISPININGSIIDTAVKILAFIILYGLIGKLFNILNALPLVIS